VSATIRDLVLEDAPMVAGIYNDAVAKRLATFDQAPTSIEDIADDLRTFLPSHPSVGVVLDGELVAYASSSPHSDYEPYRGIAEFSVYVAEQFRGRGFGRIVLHELIARCESAGFTKLLSRILMENEASRALCASLGFREVGVFERHARLDDVWRDVVIVEKLLGGKMKPSVLFVCRHNTGRSQMAEAYLRHFLGDRVDVSSAGTIAAVVPDPGVVAAMAEDGIDISAARPKLLDARRVERADRIITMGCDVEGVPRIDDDWGLPDPKGQPPERVREIRDEVKAKTRRLADEIAGITGSPDVETCSTTQSSR
jgi:L-amino acid N-acyltransferase YncA/protein-tyrosine-phosphatase